MSRGGLLAETPGHAPPGWRAVGRLQIALVGRGRRRELLLLGGVMVALMLGQRFPGGSAAPTTQSAAQILLSSSHVLLLFVALLWPTSVWRGEGPGRRAYHWSLPVDRRVHDLLRVSAGAAWLLGTVAAGAVLGLGIGVAIEGGIPAGDWRVYPGLLLALLVLYGFGSVAALVSDHPFRWIIGVPVLYVGVRSIAGLAGLGSVTTALQSAETGRLGLATALFGPRSFTSSFWRQVLGDGAPLQAGLLWFLIAAGAVLLAASLHREPTGRET